MAWRRTNLNLIFMLLLLGLFGCSRANKTPPLPASTVAAVTVETTPTSTPVPTATAVPSATPSPTPIIPNVQVREQTLTEEGLIVIDSVSIPASGWIAVYEVADGEPGSILGYKEIPAGTTAPVTLNIDARQASPSLIARLHMDEGTSGEFEYPSADPPYKTGASEAAATFAVDLDLPMPTIEVVDQTITLDGLLRISNVFALEPGWLVIHNLVGDRIGPVIGQIPVQEGQNEDLILPVRWDSAAEELIAILYEDKEQPGGFNPDIDFPVLVQGVPVVDEFVVSLPPDILAYDQPIIDGKLVIERAVSNGPGWIAVYFDDNGQQGLIIGFAQLEDGLNELVEVDIVETAVTPRLFLNLHEDTGNAGKFDFPTADLPLIYEGELLPPFVVHTNPGNYLVTMDQPLSDENQLIVPLIVTDLDTWIVIYTVADDNNPAEILGQTWLPAGINRNVLVTLQSGLKDNRLLAVLHQDGGTLEEFDYPAGADIPLIRNQVRVQSPITILAPPGSDDFIP